MSSMFPIIADCIAGFGASFLADTTFQTYLTTNNVPFFFLNMRVDDIKQYTDFIAFDYQSMETPLASLDLTYEHNLTVVCMIKASTAANLSAIETAFATAFPDCMNSYLYSGGWVEYTRLEAKPSIVQLNEDVIFFQYVFYQ